MDSICFVGVLKRQSSLNLGYRQYSRYIFLTISIIILCYLNLQKDKTHLFGINCLIILMTQKYSYPTCSIANIRFEVLHKGKIVNYTKSNDNRNENRVNSARKFQGEKSSIDGFIPSYFKNYKKQFTESFKFLRKGVLPLKALDYEHKGFPLRKVRTSQSYRTLPNKKQKNFQMGEVSEPIFTNPRLSKLIEEDKKQKQKLPEYMSKSMLDIYNSQKSSSSSKIRKSFF